MKLKVAVIGAGVIGLSTSYKILQDHANCQLTIFSQEFSPHTTGDVSAGFVFPYLIADETEIRNWLKMTLDHLSSLYQLPNAYEIGIQPLLGFSLGAEGSGDIYKMLPSVEKLTEKESKMLTSGVSTGIKFTTWTCLCSKYLPWLSDRILELGGVFVQKKITSFEELSHFDLIVNCSGISAIHLTGDPKLTPTRGQVTVVKAPWIKYGVLQDGDYILPRLDDVVLGGTAQKGDFNLKVDPADSAKIWRNCCKLNPSLKYAEVIDEKVGLRPYRGTVRLEIEEKVLNGKTVPILHNYGHGGSGVTLHWGCAIDASNILLKYLQKNNLTSKL